MSTQETKEEQRRFPTKSSLLWEGNLSFSLVALSLFLIFDATDTAIVSFTSTNGGNSWNSPVTVSPLFLFFENTSIRDGGGLPSAEVDGSGKVYLVWQDCRFEPNCAINYGSANDIVMSTSTDGVIWSSPQRIPIDPVGSGVNHIIPGIYFKA